MTAEQALALIKDVIEQHRAQRLGAGQAMQTISLILNGNLPYDAIAVAVAKVSPARKPTSLDVLGPRR